MMASPPRPAETLNFLGPASAAEPSRSTESEPISASPSSTLSASAPLFVPPTLGALQSRAPSFWQTGNLSLHLATPPVDAKIPPHESSLFAALRVPPRNGNLLHSPPSAEVPSIRLPEPKREPGFASPFLFSPQSLPAAHSQRFMSLDTRPTVNTNPLGGGHSERSSLEKELVSNPDVRQMIDALVVERLREFTNPGRPTPHSGGLNAVDLEGGGRAGSSEREGNLGEWFGKSGSKEDMGKKDSFRSRESESDGGRRKRGRSRSRSPSPQDRVGGNREAVRKYREKKKVEFASMQNQLAQLHKKVAQQEEQLKHQAAVEGDLANVWKQVSALQEKVTSGQNLLVSELFAIKPPKSLM